jgi:hypothetical protein
MDHIAVAITQETSGRSHLKGRPGALHQFSTPATLGWAEKGRRF